MDLGGHSEHSRNAFEAEPFRTFWIPYRPGGYNLHNSYNRHALSYVTECNRRSVTILHLAAIPRRPTTTYHYDPTTTILPLRSYHYATTVRALLPPHTVRWDQRSSMHARSLALASCNCAWQLFASLLENVTGVNPAYTVRAYRTRCPAREWCRPGRGHSERSWNAFQAEPFRTFCYPG